MQKRKSATKVVLKARMSPKIGVYSAVLLFKPDLILQVPRPNAPLNIRTKKNKTLEPLFPTTALTRLGIFHLLIWLPIVFLTAAVVGR